MTYINPITGALLPAANAQAQAAADKNRQLRRREARLRDSTASDRFEHSVESAQAIEPVQDEPGKQSKQERPARRQGKKRTGGGHDEPPAESHIDLTA